MRISVLLGVLLTTVPRWCAAADFYTPVSVTAPNSVEFYPVARLHQGPGVGYAVSAPHDGLSGQTWVTDAPGGYPADYYNFRPAPVLIIDLGQDRHLTEISTWGYTTANDNGVKTFALRFATAAQGTAGFAAPQGPFDCAKSDITRHSHPLTPVTARYVEFTCTDNYFTGTGAAGGDRVGLGEIAFEYTPEPIAVKIEATPGIVDFGSHAADPGTVTRTVTVRNTGASQALTLSSVVVESADAARFSVQSFPSSIAPGAEGTMTLDFNSGGAVSGCWFAWLRIHSNDPVSPVMTLGLLASVNCTPEPPGQPVFSHPAGTFGVNFPLTLTSPTPDAAIIFTTDGSVPSLSNGQPYIGPVQITRTTMVRAACVLAGQLSGIESFGYIRLAPALLTKTSPLPMLVVENFGAGSIPDKGWTTGHQTGAGLKQKPRQPAMLSFHDRSAATGRATLLGPSSLASRAGIRVRGAFSSTWFPKPYSFETWKEDDTDKSVALLGMPKESDWILYHPHPSYDLTMIYNTYIWELSRLTGRWAPQFRYVEVYVNEDGSDLDPSDRRGLYALVESVKRDADRMDFEPLSADGATGGWMHSFNRMDPEPEDGFPAANGATSPQFFRTAGPNRLLQTVANVAAQAGDDIPRQYNCFINFDDPNGYEITPVQRAAIEGWFVQFEDALYNSTTWRDPVAGYRQHLDTRDFIDYFQLLNLARQGDGLLLSMYPWVSSGVRKLRMGPMWDFNNGAYSGTPNTTLYYRQSELWYPRLFADPDFLNEYIDRWYELRRGPLANANLNAIADQQAALITTEIANAQGLTTATWTSRLTAMKNFLTQRADWIDTQYLRPPNFSPAPGVQPGPFTLTLTNPTAESVTIYYTLDSSDPRSAAGTPQGTAYAGPFSVNASAMVKARMYSTTTSRWSGLNFGYYFTTTPASAANIVISEIHYNPPGSADAGEFLEVMNISPQPVDLTGAQFDRGIQFAFAAGTVLGPGERAIVAASAADFSGPRVLGSYGPGSALDNGGEQLRLRAWDGTVIKEFIWDDVTPWPELPDGDGPSLTLIRPHTNPDPALPQNWRISVQNGGTPGGTDTVQFTGDPLADDDGDGVSNFVSYALGNQLPAVSRVNDQITWDIPFNPAAEDVSILPEWSADMITWLDAATLFTIDTRFDLGRRLIGPLPAAARKVFFRARVIWR
jgi:hypothetical protein